MTERSNEYITQMEGRRSELIPAIEALMAECDSLPVGSGFVDVITRPPQVELLISGLTELKVAINVVTLWCDCTAVNIDRYGCPHGYGGPGHGDGYFSEMCERDYFNISDQGIDLAGCDGDLASIVNGANRLAMEYASMGMQQRHDYSPCLVPGFWLVVPKGWKRQSYRMPSDA
jgi:hypothetical protein